jgi:hypothetical protein
MKRIKLGMGCLLLALLLTPLFPLPGRAASQEELFEKIKLLERQIQELKDMKAEQSKILEKKQHCIRAMGTDKLCACLAEALPGDVSFEQYVHGFVSTAEEPREGQGAVDALHVAREKCVQKGLFW